MMEAALAWISLFVGVFSLAVSGFAIWFARTTESETRGQFEKTKDLLAEIDKRSSMIERTVSESQREMMATIAKIIDSAVIPKKPDMGEVFAMEMMRALISDPSQGQKTLQALQPFMEMGQRTQQQNKQNE